jgi:hypothetical protein
LGREKDVNVELLVHVDGSLTPELMDIQINGNTQQILSNNIISSGQHPSLLEGDVSTTSPIEILDGGCTDSILLVGGDTV